MTCKECSAGSGQTGVKTGSRLRWWDDGRSGPLPIVAVDPVPVAPVHHAAPPALVLEIPAHRLPKARLERFLGHEAELGGGLRRVERVPTVVTRTVPDERD